jgi:putative FmdB family regulatory protein
MPSYDFRCRECGEDFEAQVATSERPPCPACGAFDPERLFTPFAGPFTVGLRGYAARRSNATRKTREELRHEGFAKDRERRREQ